ncbi:MAG TPA: pyridoxamine 5'-phosphate oxidase family protein [Candidatus Nitrosotalea sp.]|nr:pyridoxamine 5'-phosphate oxidase family protein [Candidatus Nitrosotalea sp.]
MQSTEPEGAMEVMSEMKCLEILGQHNLGRIAIVVDGQPQIFPVNYAVNGRIISFLTAAGSKLLHAPTSKVAFEIDQYDSLSGVGWSVMVQGVATDATDMFDDVSWAARAVTPRPLAPGAKPYRVAIEASTITGRRFRPGV